MSLPNENSEDDYELIPNVHEWLLPQPYYDDVLGWCYMGKVHGDSLTIIGHAPEAYDAFKYTNDKLNERTNVLTKTRKS